MVVVVVADVGFVFVWRRSVIAAVCGWLALRIGAHFCAHHHAAAAWAEVWLLCCWEVRQLRRVGCLVVDREVLYVHVVGVSVFVEEVVAVEVVGFGGVVVGDDLSGLVILLEVLAFVHCGRHACRFLGEEVDEFELGDVLVRFVVVDAERVGVWVWERGVFVYVLHRADERVRVVSWLQCRVKGGCCECQRQCNDYFCQDRFLHCGTEVIRLFARARRFFTYWRCSAACRACRTTASATLW